MKTIKRYGLLLLLLVSILAGGCSDDEKESLSFYDDYYEVPIHGTRYIPVKSGNGNYTLQIENNDLLSASEDDGWSNPAGTILIRGLLTGDATLKVTDNVTHESQNLNIKITDNYEVLRISPFDNNHPVFSQIPFLFMVNNTARDLYLADDNGENSATGNGIQVKGKGTYALTMENNQPFLALTYATDEEGKLTDDSSFSPTSHRFSITPSSALVLHRLNENLNLGWETSLSSYSTAPMPFTIEIQSTTNSEDKFRGTLERIEIPNGILNL